MSNEWGDIPLQVFQRVIPEARACFPLDPLMLRIFVELDGRKDLGDVAQALGVGMTPLLRAIARLGALGLIEPSQTEVERVPDSFFAGLVRQLSLEIGPVAHVILSQTLEQLGYGISGFPARKVPLLVDLVAREIPDEKGRNRFRRWLGGTLDAPPRSR